MPEVTAAVSRPSPYPKRPRLYIVIGRAPDWYAISRALTPDEDWAKLTNRANPGSVIVTVPGEDDPDPLAELQAEKSLTTQSRETFVRLADDFIKITKEARAVALSPTPENLAALRAALGITPEREAALTAEVNDTTPTGEQ